MKPARILFCTFLIALALEEGCAPAKETGSGDGQAVRASVTARNYTFIATSALPQRGRTVQLTSQYFLKVTRDTITASLPYFGRAYSAPIGRTYGGIEFVSTHFTYKEEERGKKGWTISIDPNDAQDVQRLTLTLGEGGYGDLLVTSTYRQPITFNGRLK